MVHRPTEDEALKRLEKQAKLIRQIKSEPKLTDFDIEFFNQSQNSARTFQAYKRRGYDENTLRRRLRLVTWMLELMELRR